MHGHDGGCVFPLQFITSISASALSLLCWAYRTLPVVFPHFAYTSGKDKLQPDLAVWFKKKKLVM